MATGLRSQLHTVLSNKTNWPPPLVTKSLELLSGAINGVPSPDLLDSLTSSGQQRVCTQPCPARLPPAVPKPTAAGCKTAGGKGGAAAGSSEVMAPLLAEMKELVDKEFRAGRAHMQAAIFKEALEALRKLQEGGQDTAALWENWHAQCLHSAHEHIDGSELYAAMHGQAL